MSLRLPLSIDTPAEASDASRHPLDAYYTPRPLAQALIEQLPITASQSVLEPSSGGGAFVQALLSKTPRVTALDIEQAITDAQAQAANAATTARAASGPALAAAQEAARIARIGYREGKFGQLELLDAERTLAETRVAAIDALANYQNARAQVERLTAPAPNGGNQ